MCFPYIPLHNKGIFTKRNAQYVQKKAAKQKQFYHFVHFSIKYISRFQIVSCLLSLLYHHHCWNVCCEMKAIHLIFMRFFLSFLFFCSICKMGATKHRYLCNWMCVIWFGSFISAFVVCAKLNLNDNFENCISCMPYSDCDTGRVAGTQI